MKCEILTMSDTHTVTVSFIFTFTLTSDVKLNMKNMFENQYRNS